MVLYHTSTSRDLQVGLTFEQYVYKQTAHTIKDNVPPWSVTSYGTKPIIRDELWIKRSPLGNLEGACYMKLMLRFSKTRAKQ